MLSARPYQADTVKKAVDYAAENPRGRLLVVCPPGGGKTLIAALMMRALAGDCGLRGLAWAHRRELVGQMRDHLVESGIPSELIGVEMAGDKRNNSTAPIQVGSVDTLRHRAKPLADFVISDEAHRDASDGRRKLRALYPDAFHCGFTATPVRLDGRGLRAEYDEMIIAAQPSELIAKGWLAAPTIYTVPTELLPDLRAVKKRGGDFEARALEAATNKRALVGNIVEHWQRHAKNQRTICFPVSIKHSRAIVGRFIAAGVTAAHLDGTMSQDARSDVLEQLRRGAIRVVSSVGVLSEGIDVPSVRCVIMARPTASLVLFIQQGGRCMRPWRGNVPIILDHAGNCERHNGTPFDDMPWALTDGRERSSSGPTIKVCKACFAVVAIGCRSCPQCSNIFSASTAEPEEERGDLVVFKPRFSEEEKQATTSHIQSFAAARGLPADWVKKVCDARLGVSL